MLHVKFSGIEALITGFCDEYPRILVRKREIFVAAVIAVYYVGSLPGVTYVTFLLSSKVKINWTSCALIINSEFFRFGHNA